MRDFFLFGVAFSLACTSSRKEDDSGQPDDKTASLTCAWLSPAEGEVYAPINPTFEISVLGAAEGAVVSWQSSIDGPLGESTVSDEQAALSLDSISSGQHDITATASDGEASCELQVSLSYGLEPNIVFLSPSDGLTFGSEADVSYAVQVSDADDPIDALVIHWRLNGSTLAEQSPSSDGTATLPVDLPVGEHTLSAEVEDSLGLTASASLSVSINGAPSEPLMSISPKPATTLDILTANIDPVTDPEGDVLTETFQWLKDGVVTSLSGTSLPAEATQKGETWTFRYTVEDSYTSHVVTDSVTIENTPPSLSGVSISPNTGVNSASSLSCSYAWTDPDETPLIDVLWRNETLSADLSSSETLALSPSLVSPGDTVSCTVTLTDSDGESVSMSDSVQVINSPPIISNMGISSNTSDAYNDSMLACQASITDPEGSPLITTFEWTNISQGQSLGQSQSLQLSSSTAAPNDYLRCDITATDMSGDSNTASAVVQIMNRAPTVSAVSSSGPTALEGDLISCIATISDPDNDSNVSSSITWTNLSTGVVVSTQADYLVDSSDVGSSLECTVVVTDSYGDSSTASTQVTVSLGNVYTIDGTTETWTEGSYDYDGISLINGAMLYVEGNVILNVAGAFTVDASSQVNGDGGGHAPNSSQGTGNGPCPGVWVSGDAASGAGYGGDGGDGGTDSSTNIAQGGCSTGSSAGLSIEKGSSGGSSDNVSGGAGGASLWVNAAQIVIEGDISMDGDEGGCCNGRNGGGGAGGGILLSADTVTVSGYLSAAGGNGGDGSSSANDGGGGGGGGRIKLFSTQSTSFTGSYTVDGGLGGIYGDYQSGQPGAVGTFYQN